MIRIIVLPFLILAFLSAIVIQVTIALSEQFKTGQLVYQSNRNDHYDIYVLDVGRGFSYQLTHGSAIDISPRWSPDGKWIAFSSDIEDTWNVYIMTATGRNLTLLTDPAVDDSFPSWSPDGEWILFESKQGGDDWDIHRFRPDGTDRENLTDNEIWSDTQAIWSPTGDEFIFLSNRDGPRRGTYILSLETGETRTLLHDSDIDGSFSWSPDGSEVLFVSERDQPSDFCAEGRGVAARCILYVNIFRMPVAGGDIQRLTARTTSYWSPVWSPDGKQIAFASTLFSENWSLYTMSPDGENMTRLTDANGNDNFLAWRP